MNNGIIKIAFVVGLIGGLGYLAYRLGVSNCRESVATESSKVQQMVQETDRTIRETVLSASHSDNLRWLCENYKRAD